MLFENRYIRTSEDIKEAYKYQFFKRTSRVVLYALMAAMWILYIVMSVISGDFSPLTIFMITFIPIWFALMFFIYLRSVKIHNARESEMLGGKPLEIEFSANDEGICIKASDGSDISLYYSQIKMVVRTKNLIIIVTKANLMHILRKDSFTVGNEEDFLHFMLENRVKVK